MSRPVRLILLAAVVGALSGAVTAAFLYAFNLVKFVVWEWAPSRVPGTVSDLAVSGGLVLALGLLIGVCLRLWGRPVEPDLAEEQYSTSGRVESGTWRTALWATLSLGSGGAIGPEAPVADLTGSLGTRFAGALRLGESDVRAMTCAAVAGGFSALFGSPAVGAILAIELLEANRERIERLTIVAGLASGATGFAVAAALLGRGFEPIYVFPRYAVPRLPDLLWALPAGALGACVGLAFRAVQRRLRAGLLPLQRRPVFAALLAAVSVVAAASVSPSLLFSGQALTDSLLRMGPQMTAYALVGLVVARLGLAAWQLSTGYYGGTIFPLITAGAALGLALHSVAPFISPGVAVLGTMAGLLAGTIPVPLGVTVLVGAISQPSLLPVAAVAAIVGSLMRRAVDARRRA